MSTGSTFSAILAVAMLLCSMAAYAQVSKAESSSSTVNIDDALSNAGLPPDTSIVKYNDISTVTLTDPILVVKGSGLDPLEQQVFNALSKKYQLNASYLVGDSTRTFDGQDIQNYDIIAIGGPLHNAFSALQLSHGVLKVNSVHVKDTGLVVESEKMPMGHTLLVVASFASYTYVESPDTTTVPNEPGGGGGIVPTQTAGVTAVPTNANPEQAAQTVDDMADELYQTVYSLMHLEIQPQDLEAGGSTIISDMQSDGEEQIDEQEMADFLNAQNQMFETMTNVIKYEHDMEMQAIGNMK